MAQLNTDLNSKNDHVQVNTFQAESIGSPNSYSSFDSFDHVKCNPYQKSTTIQFWKLLVKGHST